MKKIIPVFLALCSVAFCVTDAEMDRLYAEAIANAKTEKEKTLAIYEQRIGQYARKKTAISAIFRPKDGIDQFEALLLAKVYFMQNFRLCGDIQLPEKKDSSWVVTMSVGRLGDPAPPAIIDARTGKLHCDGHPDVTNALAYLKDFMKPSQSSQPSPTSRRG